MNAIAKKQMKKLNRKNRGQGMTEYIIIVALIGIAAIGVVTLFGDNIRRMFASSNAALSGVDAPDTGNVEGQQGDAIKRNVRDFGTATAE